MLELTPKERILLINLLSIEAAVHEAGSVYHQNCTDLIAKLDRGGLMASLRPNQEATR